MTPLQFYRKYDKEHVERMAKKAGTSFGNFKLIALGHGSASKYMAERLAKASKGEMTELEILYPERYDGKKGK